MVSRPPARHPAAKVSRAGGKPSRRRINYCSVSGPATAPVNHALIDGDILLRTSPIRASASI